MLDFEEIKHPVVQSDAVAAGAATAWRGGDKAEFEKWEGYGP
jgi:hypothetical protein